MICYECGLPIEGEPVYDLCGKALHPGNGFPHPCVVVCSAKIEALRERNKELLGQLNDARQEIEDLGNEVLEMGEYADDCDCQEPC
jgi:hypothetical protein